MKSIKKILIPVIIGVVILTSAIIASVVGIKVKQNKEDNAVQDQVEIEDTQTSGAAANTISWGTNQGTVTYTTGTNYSSTTSYYITFTLRQTVGTVATYNRRMTGGGASYTWNFLSYLDSSNLNLAYRNVYVQVQMRQTSYKGTVLSSVKTASKNIISIKADPNGGRWDTTSAIGDWSSTSSSTGTRTRYLLEGQKLTATCFTYTSGVNGLDLIACLTRYGYSGKYSTYCAWFTDTNASNSAITFWPTDGGTYYAGWQVNSEVFNEGYFLTGDFFGDGDYATSKSVVYGTDLGSTGNMYFSGSIPNGLAANFNIWCSYNDGDYESGEYIEVHSTNTGRIDFDNFMSSKNAGTYKFYVYAFLYGTNCYNGPYAFVSTKTSSTYTLTITKANISPSVSMSGYTYGGTKSSPSVSGNSGGGSVTYYYNTSNSNSGGTAWSSVSSSTSLNAGTYYMYAVVGSTTNYNGATTPTKSFTISKASISPTVNMSGYTYGGTKSTPSISGNTGGGSVTYYYNTSNSNSGGTAWSSVSSSTSLNAGTYYMYAVVGSTTNYNGATTATRSFTISKANISPTVNMSGYTYGGTKSSPSISGNTGGGSVTYYYNTSNSNSGGTAWSNVSSSTSLNAGTYYMYAVVGSTTNYNGATTATKSFTIARATGSVSISPASRTVTYGTSSTTFTVSGTGTLSASDNNGTATVSVSGSTLTVSNLASINAGTTITVTVTAAQSTNYNSASKTCTVTISRTTGSVSISPASRTVTYGTSSTTFTVSGTGTLSASDNNGTATVSVSGSTLTVSNLASISAGTTITITVTAAQSTNYNSASKTCTVTISRTTGSVSISPASRSLAYGTSSTTFTVSGTGALSASDNNSTATVSISGSTLTVSNLASIGAGTTITITVTAAQSTNYNSASKTCTVTISTCVLTANANGGSISSTSGWSGTGNTATKTLNYGASYSTLPSVSRTGYTLKGWYTASSGGTQVTSSTTMGRTNTTIYAQWTINTYTVKVTRNSNNVTHPTSINISASGCTISDSSIAAGESSTISHTYSTSPITISFEFTRSNTSYNYYADINVNGSWNSSMKNSGSYSWTPTSNITIHLGILELFTVKSQAGTGVDSATFYYIWNDPVGPVTTREVYYGGGIDFSATVKTGYTFKGWYTNSAGTGTAVSTSTDFSIEKQNPGITDSATYYAIATPNTYTITYNGNGHTGGSTSNSTHTYDVSKALNTNGYTKQGYSFMGWATSASGSKVYNDGQAVLNLTSTNGATVTLYAVWAVGQSPYTVNLYVMNTSGSYALNSTVTRNGTTNSTITLSTLAEDAGSNIIVPNGIEYSYGTVGGSTVTSTTVLADGSRTINLYFERLKHTLTRDLDGGYVSTDNSRNYTVDVYYQRTLSFGATDLKVGYSLVGYTLSGGGGATVTSLASNGNATFTMGTEDVTLTSQWEANTYNLYYDYNDGSNPNLYGYHLVVYSEMTYSNGEFTTASASSLVSGNAYSFMKVQLYNGSSYVSEISIKDSTGTFVATFTKTEDVNRIKIAANGNLADNGIYISIDNLINSETYTIQCLITSYSSSTIKFKNIKIEQGSTSTAYTQEAKAVTYDSSYGTLPTPTRTGYTFNGWVNNYFDLESFVNFYNDSNDVNTGYTPKLMADGHTIRWSGPSGYAGSIGYITYKPGVTVDGQTYGTALANGTYRLSYYGYCPTINEGQSTTNLYVVNADGTIIASVDYVPCDGERHFYSYTFTVDDNFGGFRLRYNYGYWAYFDNIILERIDDHTPTYTTSSSTVKIPIDHTLTASWDINSYTLTANANGGSISSTSGWSGTGNSATKSVTYQASYGTLPTVTREGYTFKGWYTASSGGTQVTSSTTMGAGNITIYAQWDINSYTLTANANGGSISTTTGWSGTGNTATKTLNYGASYGTLPSVSRTGYTFKGWYTASSGGTQVTSSTTMGAGNTTIYAQWDINSYTLTANANGGSISSTSGWSGTGNTATKSVTYQTSYGTLPSVSRTGYTLKGWYTQSSGGTQVTSSTTMGRTNTTIYAQWTINSYTLTANANGGSITSTSGWSGTGNTATKTLNYGASYGTLPSVSRTGYTLKGWYTASSGGTQVTASTTMGAGNTTIYAQWTINSYTLTANANGGSISTTTGWSGTGNTATKTLNYGASYSTLPSVSRTGYTLKGWYTASSGGTQVTSSTTMGRTNTTIYAQWTINTYTVTVTRSGNITHPTNVNITASGCTISDSSIAAGESSTISHTYSTSPITISFEFTRSDSSHSYYASINMNGSWYGSMTNSGSYNWTPTGNIDINLYIYEQFLIEVEAGTGISNAEFDYILNSNFESSLTSKNALYGAGIDFRATVEEGYTFKGWYTNSEGIGTAVSTSANFSIEEKNPGITESATYYAIAEPVGLQVVLNKQGGGNNETIDVTYTQALPNVTPPVRDGYTFGGYFTQPLGQGEQYYNSNGQGIKNWDKTSGAVLYAKWTAVMNIVYVGEQDNIRDATDINLSVTSGSFSANSLSLGETARYSIVAGASVDSITITATRAGSGNYYINFGSNCSTSSSLNTATYSVVPSNRTINIYLAQRMYLRVTHTTDNDEYIHSTNLEFSSSGAELDIVQSVLERGEQNFAYAIYNSGDVVLTASATNSQYDYYMDVLYAGDYVANPISWDTTFDAYIYYSLIERFIVDIGSTTGISSAQFSVDWRGNITTYSSAQSVLQGSGITFTAQLEQGYSFKGWYDNPEGTGNPLSTSLEYEYCVYANPGGGGVRSNVTLYAVANISTYTVTVTRSGDNRITHPTSVNISASGCTISDSSIAVGESSTISHTYSTSPITISFEFTRSDSSHSYHVDVYIDNQYNSGFTNSGNYSWTPTGNIDINLYIYEIFLVKVEAGTGISNAEFDYIWNNTEGPLTTREVFYGAGIDFRATVEEGYTFKGWYTNSEGTGNPVSTSANFSIEKQNPGITDSATYYAIATPNSYTLTANANGGTISSTSGWSGTGNTATKSVTYQASYGTLPSVSRTGYTFKGWYTQSSGGTQVTSSTIMGIGNTTIYAQWTINTYTVTVTRSGNITHPTNVNITASGCTISDSSIAAGESATISHTYSTSPITISFEFTRSDSSHSYYASINMNGSWYGSMTNSGSYNWTPTGNIDINLYIYEQFLIEVEAGTGISNAEFDYNLNGNIESSLTSKNALYGAGIDFRATVEEGYTFKGWYTNSEGTGTPVSTSANFSIEEKNPGITESATYYAIASVDNYSVTLDYNGGTDNLFNNNNNLLDGTFENGETGSPTIQSEGIADISNNSFNGNNSLRFNSTVPGTYGSRLVYWISSLQNGDYRLRARVMASEDTELILTVERNDTYAQLIQTYIDLQANTWVQIDGTFNVNFDASMALIFRIVDLNVDLYIDDIEITNISSNYSPKTSYEYNINTGEVKLPYAVKSGYVFKGWNTKADGTGDYVTSYNGALQANVTYYAIYELSAATVVISSDKSSIKYGSEGATISASVDTNGLSSSLTYQWYRGTSEDFEMNSTSLISGANSSTYNHTASLTDAGTYYYKVLVTNSKDGETAKTIASNTIQLVVNPGDANLEISMQGYTYNETVASPQVENNISGGEVTFYYNTSESSTGGTLWNNITPTSLNAGTYYMYATVSANGNYLAGVSNIVEFVVAKGDLNSTITTNNNNLFSKVYDGTELSAYITAPFAYTVYFGPTIDYGAVIENSANSLTKIAGRTTIGSETYYYRITAPNFEDEVGNITLTINPREVAVVWEIETYTYNGTDQGESVKAYYEDASGTKVYCDVSFNGEDTVFMNAGSYIATASDESGVYILTNTTIEVEMNKASVTITADNKTITYGDNAPTFTHSVSGNIASKDSYTVSYSVVDIDNSPVIVSNTTDAGQYIIKPSSNLSTDNYNISYENGSLIINKYNLSNATIDDIEDYTYTGYDITPKPSVTALGVVLTENVHYMYSYDENVKVGEATVTATAVEDSNFTGSISTTFNITSVVVQIPTSQSELVYTAQVQTANIPTSSQYTLTNNTATDAGNYNATASLVDKENYTWSDGSVTNKLIPFTIKKADTEITLEKQTVELRTGTTTTNKASVIGVGTFETGAGITVTGLEEYANISAGDLINKESIITIEALKSINSPQTVTVTFSGDKNHNSSIATFTIEIPSIIVQVITSNGNVTINNTISGTDNEVLLNSNITFTATPNTGYGLIYYIVGDSTTYINSSDLGANYTSPAITVTEDKIENDVLTITVMFDQIVNIDINITGDEGSLGDGITFTANVNSNAVAHNYSNGQLTAFATSTITYSIEAGTIENQYYAIKSVKVNGESISTNVTTASGTYLASELESIDIQTSKIYQATDKNIVDDSKTVATVEIEVFDNNELLIINEEKYILEDAQVNYKVTKSDSNYDFLGIMVNGELRLYNQEDASTWDYDENTNTYTWKNQVYSENVSNAEPVVLERWFTPGVTTDKTINVQVDSGINAELANTVIGYKYALATGIFTSGTASLYAGTWQVNLINSNASVTISVTRNGSVENYSVGDEFIIDSNTTNVTIIITE